MCIPPSRRVRRGASHWVGGEQGCILLRKRVGRVHSTGQEGGV